MNNLFTDIRNLNDTLGVDNTTSLDIPNLDKMVSGDWYLMQGYETSYIKKVVISDSVYVKCHFFQCEDKKQYSVLIQEYHKKNHGYQVKYPYHHEIIYIDDDRMPFNTVDFILKKYINKIGKNN